MPHCPVVYLFAAVCRVVVEQEDHLLVHRLREYLLLLLVLQILQILQFLRI